MVTLKETITNGKPIELQFNSIEKAMENVDLQIESCKNRIGNKSEANMIISVSNNKWHSVDFGNELHHTISWSVYYKNGQKIEFSADVTEGK